MEGLSPLGLMIGFPLGSLLFFFIRDQWRGRNATPARRIPHAGCHCTNCMNAGAHVA